jgi:hypothetical protein
MPFTDANWNIVSFNNGNPNSYGNPNAAFSSLPPIYRIGRSFGA